MGIPVPSRMTPEEIDAADRFSLLVWGKVLFDREPSHNGRHGYTCEFCVSALEEQRVAAEERLQPVRQPWELRMAA
jgi:hypothetical protein